MGDLQTRRAIILGMDSEGHYKKIKAKGNAYNGNKGSKTETLSNYPIRYNMLSVYITEPVNINQVYSDNFQKQVDIQKVAEHHYKIKFPDGNFNEYF